MAAVACVAGAAPGVVVTFDDSDHLALFSQVQNGGDAGTYSDSATGGIGGSGGVATSIGSNTTAVYQGQSFNFSQPGTALTISMFVRRAASAPTAPAHLLNLGFTADPTGDLRLDGPFMNVRAAIHSGAQTGYLQTVNSVGDAGGNTVTGNQTPGDVGTAIGSGWFKLTATFVNAGDGMVIYSGALDSYGADGAAFVSNVWTRSEVNIANSPMALDAAVYAAFRADGRSGSAAALDTFNVSVSVPEPAAMSVLALGAAALLARRRRV